MMFSLAQPSEKSAQLRLMPSAPRRTDLRNNAPFPHLGNGALVGYACASIVFWGSGGSNTTR